MYMIALLPALICFALAAIGALIRVAGLNRQRREAERRQAEAASRAKVHRPAAKHDPAPAKDAQPPKRKRGRPRKIQPDPVAADPVRPETVSSSGDLCMTANRFADSKAGSVPMVVTEKLDGVRCIAVKNGPSVLLLTRTGNPISGSEEVVSALSALPGNMMLDGELISISRPGETRQQTYERSRADVQSGRNGLVFHIFDLLDIAEFEARKSSTPYSQRRIRLDALSDLLPKEGFLKIVPILYTGSDPLCIRQLMEKICASGGEGVMLNQLDAPYQFRRSDALMKLKPSFEVDLKIIAIREGSGRNAGRAGSIVVDFKGVPVGVSSGLTAQLRAELWNRQSLYLGRVVTVRYTEESVNAAGRISLRFPRFIELREEGKQVSYA